MKPCTIMNCKSNTGFRVAKENPVRNLELFCLLSSISHPVILLQGRQTGFMSCFCRAVFCFRVMVWV